MKAKEQLNDEDKTLARHVNRLLASEDYAETRDDHVHLTVLDALLETVPRARPSFRGQLRSEVRAEALGQARSIQPRVSFRRLLVPSLTLILLIALIAATPQGRSFAQEVISFFTRAASDIITMPTVIPPVEFQEYSTLKEAGSEIGFPAKTPRTLPTGYALDTVQAILAEQALIIIYSGPTNQTGVMTPRMTITQRALPFDDLIGPSAEIVTLSVDGNAAEYVAGGWLYVESTSEGRAKEFHWEETLVPAQTLRWILDGFYFEITFLGSDTQPGFLRQLDLVKVAESID